MTKINHSLWFWSYSLSYHFGFRLCWFSHNSCGRIYMLVLGANGAEEKERKLREKFNFLSDCADSADFKIKKISKICKISGVRKKTLKNFSVFYIFSTDCFVVFIPHNKGLNKIPNSNLLLRSSYLYSNLVQK